MKEIIFEEKQQNYAIKETEGCLGPQVLRLLIFFIQILKTFIQSDP